MRVGRFNTSAAADRQEGTRLLCELLAAFGADSEIRPPLYCDYGMNTSIGARTYINFGLVLLDVASVRIGDDVQIGPYVQLLTASHPRDARLRRDKWESAQPISISNDVWIGGGAIVCPGSSVLCVLQE